MTADLSDYDPETIALVPDTNLTIFILSTFGEGDPSDNATAFWEWIEKANLSLSNLHYMAFSLGNKPTTVLLMSSPQASTDSVRNL